MIQMFPFKKYNKISYELLSKQPILLNGTLGLHSGVYLILFATSKKFIPYK